MGKLFKTGKASVDIGDKVLNLESTNAVELGGNKDTFFKTMVLMYLSMKQKQHNIDEPVFIDNDEMVELFNYIEYAKTLPYFIHFLKENK